MALIIPPWIIPREESHEWLDESSSVFQPEYSPGATQRQSYGGMRLRINRSHRVRGEELAILESTLLAADGKFVIVYARGLHRPQVGSIAATELITNNTFTSTTGYTASTAEIVLSAVGRALRVRRTAIGAAANILFNPITVSTSADVRYVFRVFVRPGVGNLALQFRFGTTAGGTETDLTNPDATLPGLYEVVPAVSAGTTMHISIRTNIASTLVGDYFDIPYVSMSRCIMVNGASQSGSTLLVNGGTASSDGLLLPGDFVSLGKYGLETVTNDGCELKMVTEPLTLDSSRAGYLKFKPQMFRSPATATAIQCLEPLGKFLVYGLKVDNRFGVEADVSYTLEQNYD